jgi:predicted translin family RNA/ssDNA-binding protein
MAKEPKKKARRALGKKRVQFTMFPSTHQELERLAAAANTTMSEYVEALLLRHFKARRTK